MTPDTEQDEQRTFHCPCGNELIVCFNETERWDEQEWQALDNAKWELLGGEYRCPVCVRERMFMLLTT